MDIHEIGKRIKQARTLRNYTLDDIANEIGVAKSTIQRYENALIGKPKIPVLQSIADSLKVNPAWLSGKDVPMEIETFEQKWDKEVEEFFSKINAFDVQLRALGWTNEAQGCHASEQSLEMELFMDKDGQLIDTDNDPLVGCGGKKCEDCTENESYYLFSNGQLSFKVTTEDYSSFVDDSQTFFKERLQQLLKKSMKQMFVESSIDSNSHLEPVAARERTDIEVTDEMRKHDDNIMDDPDF